MSAKSKGRDLERKPSTASLSSATSSTNNATNPGSKLLLAAQRGEEVGLRAILRESNGAGIDERSGPKNETALECAIVEGHFGCVKVLVNEFNADTNTQGMNVYNMHDAALQLHQ